MAIYRFNYEVLTIGVSLQTPTFEPHVKCCTVVQSNISSHEGKNLLLLNLWHVPVSYQCHAAVGATVAKALDVQKAWNHYVTMGLSWFGYLLFAETATSV